MLAAAFARRGRPGGLGGRGADGRADGLLHVPLCLPDLLRRAALARGPPPHESPPIMTLPLVVLALGRWWPGSSSPPSPAKAARFQRFLEPVLGAPEEHETRWRPRSGCRRWPPSWRAAGAVIAWLLYGRRVDWLALRRRYAGAWRPLAERLYVDQVYEFFTVNLGRAVAAFPGPDGRPARASTAPSTASPSWSATPPAAAGASSPAWSAKATPSASSGAPCWSSPSWCSGHDPLVPGAAAVLPAIPCSPPWPGRCWSRLFQDQRAAGPGRGSHGRPGHPGAGGRWRPGSAPASPASSSARRPSGCPPSRSATGSGSTGSACLWSCSPCSPRWPSPALAHGRPFPHLPGPAAGAGD